MRGSVLSKFGHDLIHNSANYMNHQFHQLTRIKKLVKIRVIRG